MYVPLSKPSDRMPGQEATSTERKKSDSDKSSSQRIPLRELPMDVWWNVLDELESDLNALVACAGGSRSEGAMACRESSRVGEWR